MDQSTFKTQVIAKNELVKVEDLLDIRCSYSLEGETSDAISKRYSEELQQITNRIFIVGLFEGSAFGYVQLITHNADNDPELADGSQIAHIHDLRIKSYLQGKGFGRYLITYLEEEARFRGFKILTLGVDSWNSRAIKFYQDIGFAEFKQDPGRTDDEFVLCMKKKL